MREHTANGNPRTSPAVFTFRLCRRTLVILQRSFANALENDAFNLSQSAAHSAMVALFPALIVSAAGISLLPDTAPLRAAIGGFFDEVLPSDVFPLLTAYFVASPKSPYTARALVIAAIVSLSGASSVVSILMEGIRRALCLPRDGWGFWARRGRALLLVPLSLVPFVLATVLVVFGRFITQWVGGQLDGRSQVVFFAAALVIRWIVALAGVAGLISLIYHLGIPHRLKWLHTLPGAAMATLMWLASTLLFGWYVTRFANYSQVYGPLGAAIALLFWLYLVFFSVLCGAEFNAELSRVEGLPVAFTPDVEMTAADDAQQGSMRQTSAAQPFRMDP